MTQTSRPPAAAMTVAKFIAGIRPGDLPPAVAHEAKRSLLNFFGGAIGVAGYPVIDKAAGVLDELSGPRTATLIGRRERMDMLSAAFVNAVTSNLLDYDDTHLRTVIHPTAPVAPAVLALAETKGFSGSAVLTAFALGAEIECRIGNMVTGGHYARGWHITATCGVFGAAAACAHLLGLSAPQIANAIGIAASEAAGIAENLPTEAKNVGVGNAARNGLFAALMAAKGYDAAPFAIEGRNGWARAAGDVPDVGELVDGLGSRWELMKNTYKPYPCGIVMHSIIDAGLELRERYKLDPAAIAQVIVSGDALLMTRGDRPVTNHRDSRVSIHHSAAIALLWGKAGIPEFSDPKAMSPEIVALRAKVSAVRDDSLPMGAARMLVRMADGTEQATTVLHARGSFEKPLADGDIEAKVRELVAGAGTGLDAGRIIAGVWGIDAAARVSGLMRATQP